MVPFLYPRQRKNKFSFFNGTDIQIIAGIRGKFFPEKKLVDKSSYSCIKNSENRNTYNHAQNPEYAAK